MTTTTYCFVSVVILDPDDDAQLHTTVGNYHNDTDARASFELTYSKRGRLYYKEDKNMTDVYLIPDSREHALIGHIIPYTYTIKDRPDHF